jgi:hypothetical protein
MPATAVARAAATRAAIRAAIRAETAVVRTVQADVALADVVPATARVPADAAKSIV